MEELCKESEEVCIYVLGPQGLQEAHIQNA